MSTSSVTGSTSDSLVETLIYGSAVSQTGLPVASIQATFTESVSGRAIVLSQPPGTTTVTEGPLTSGSWTASFLALDENGAAVAPAVADPSTYVISSAASISVSVPVSAAGALSTASS